MMLPTVASGEIGTGMSAGGYPLRSEPLRRQCAAAKAVSSAEPTAAAPFTSAARGLASGRSTQPFW